MVADWPAPETDVVLKCLFSPLFALPHSIEPSLCLHGAFSSNCADGQSKFQVQEKSAVCALCATMNIEPKMQIWFCWCSNNEDLWSLSQTISQKQSNYRRSAFKQNGNTVSYWPTRRMRENKYLSTPANRVASAAPINHCLSIQTRQYNK